MDWIDKAREAVEGLGREVSKQADALSLNSQIGRLQEDAERNYAEAGRRAKQLVRQRQLLDDEIKVILERTDEIEAEIMELRKQLHGLEQDAGEVAAEQGERKCPQCGQNVQQDATFCPNCGARTT